MATDIDAVKPLPPGDLDLNKPHVQDVIDDLIRTKSQIETALNAAEDALTAVQAQIGDLDTDDFVIKTDAASSAEMETGTATDKFVTPGRMKDSILIPKVMVHFTASSGSIINSEGVSSVSRTSAGDYTINFSTAFSSSNYYVLISYASSTNEEISIFDEDNRSTTAMDIKARAGGIDNDPDEITVIIWGDQ